MVLQKTHRNHLKEMALDLLPEIKILFITIWGGIYFTELKSKGIKKVLLSEFCNIIATRLSKRMREQSDYIPLYDPLVLRISVHISAESKIDYLWSLYWAFKFPLKLNQIVTNKLQEPIVTFRDLIKSKPKQLNSITIEVTQRS
jgi:hypothetical protein